jgi:hypothetical protein
MYIRPYSSQILMQLAISREEQHSNIKFKENPSNGSPAVPWGRRDTTKLKAASAILRTRLINVRSLLVYFPGVLKYKVIMCIRKIIFFSNTKRNSAQIVSTLLSLKYADYVCWLLSNRNTMYDIPMHGPTWWYCSPCSYLIHRRVRIQRVTNVLSQDGN